MIPEILTHFPTTRVVSLSANILYLADYTNTSANVRGVEFSSEFPEINSLRIDNPNSIGVTSTIFDNRNFRHDIQSSENVEQCEAMLFPADYSLSTWIAFVELKYTTGKRNFSINRQKAKSQISNTIQVMRDRGIIPPKKRVRGIIHFAETEMIASYGFEFSLEEVLEYASKYVEMSFAHSIEIKSNMKLIIYD